MYLFFDTETTGLPKRWSAPATDFDNWPRLVQIAWLIYDNEGEKIRGKNYIIKPEGFEIPEEASKIHGITTEFALKKGKILKPVLREFSKAMIESDYIIAHNISFDEKIIESEFLRTGTQKGLFSPKKMCTKDLSTEFCAIEGSCGYKWPSLKELHIKLFGEDFEDAHDAMVDVRACAKCFFELKKLGVIAC